MAGFIKYGKTVLGTVIPIKSGHKKMKNRIKKRNHRGHRGTLRVLKKGQFIKLIYEKLSIMI